MLLLVGAMLPLKAFAAPTITEIMYDLEGTDTNREWIEVCNEGDSVSLSGWKFNDGSNHGINEPGTNGSVGSIELNSHSCLILAANATTFLSEHIGFSGTVLDTVMNLNNTEDTLSLIDDQGAVVASAEYSNSMGAVGDGLSLQWVGGTFVPRTPTPGSVASGEEPPTTSDTQASFTVSIDQNAKPVEPPKIPTPKIELSVGDRVLRGTPIVFDTKVYDASGSIRTSGYFKYNFGNGEIYESENPTPPTYTYRYAGDYLLTISYALSRYVTTPEVTFTKTITAYDPTIAISLMPPDGITLENTSKQDVDLSGFILRVSSPYHLVTLPRIVIRAGKSITLAPTITGLGLDKGQVITLFDPSGREVARFEEAVLPKAENEMAPKIQTAAVSYRMPATTEIVSSPDPVKSLQKPKNEHNVLWTIFALALAALGGLSVWYLRGERKEIHHEADAFTIQEITE